jgi:hypothetical protein
VIRQAISCDICGAEMLNANHWFVARELGAELRISAWDGRKRPRSATRHICGHKCLHKLVDDFTARTLRVPLANGEGRTDAQPSPAAFPILQRPIVGSSSGEIESYARLLTPEAPGRRAAVMPNRLGADAWKRERERQQRAGERRSIA